MTNLLADVRLALRSWRKSPGFAGISILSIALGIGANAAIFTLVDQVLLRTLPVPHPEELAQISFTGLRYGDNWGDGTDLSYPMYKDIRDNNQVFAGVVARFATAFHLGAAGRTERVAGELVSGNYFSVLGVGAAAGRVIAEADDRVPGGHPVAMLSYAFWKSRFNGDPSLIGSAATINGHQYTIIGIARAGFDGLEVGRQTQVFVPIMMKAQITPTWDALDERIWRWVRVVARLQPGVSREQAHAGLAPLFQATLEQDLASPRFASAAKDLRDSYLRNRLVIADASQGRSSLRRALTTPLWVLMATAAAVLLIACANIANLLLVRGAARQREMAVRLALGATRRRLVGQLLVESLMLAGLGALAGLAIASLTAPVVLGFFVSPDVPRPISTSPDWRIVAFTVGMAFATAVLFGVAPALQSTRLDVAPTLKDQSANVLGGSGRVRKMLVGSQIALSLLLLLGAGLFIRTLDNLLAVDIGFRADRLLSFSIDPSLNGYDPPRMRAFVKTLLERLRQSPGIDGAGVASMRLLEGNQWSPSMTVEGYRPKTDESSQQWANAVSAGYFSAMGIPILAGRDFTERDELNGAGAQGFRVAIVNETFARHYFGEASAIGHRIGFGGGNNTRMPIEIVGVVRDSKYTDVRDTVQRQVFFSFLEQAQPNAVTVYLSTGRPSEAMFAQVRQTIAELDPNIPVHGTRTLASQVALSLSRERLVATMTAVFGVLATLLAVVGLYGVMSYTVTRRTREIGIRVALGATSANISWLVIREVLVIAGVGIGAALPAAWWLGRFVSTQLYGVTPGDPLTLCGTMVLLFVVAVMAGLIPSAKAARLSPTLALRRD